ncbi:hypothetical protein SLA2020_144130 [Shorea laevis]
MLLPTEITITCIEMLVERHPSKSRESTGSSRVLQILSTSWLLLHARDRENGEQSSVVNICVNQIIYRTGYIILIQLWYKKRRPLEVALPAAKLFPNLL